MKNWGNGEVHCRNQTAELQVGGSYTGKEEEACAGPGTVGDQPLRRVAFAFAFAWAWAWAPQWYFVVTLELLVFVLTAVVMGEVW